MKAGNFFRVDDNSQFKQGIVYYRYLPVSLIKCKGGESDCPIYMEISSSSITFYLQLRGNNDIYNHSELFSIPFSKNLRTKDNLKGILRQLYDKDIDQIKKEIYTIDENYNEGTYSDKRITQKNITGKSEKEKGCIIQYRELILDFLFDLEHSKVFSNSPSYERMEDVLAEYPFFIALSAKYDFYYKRDQLINDLLIDSKITQKLYSDYYKARNQWVKIICSSGIQDTITPDNKWFLYLEEEHKRVIFEEELFINYWKARITVASPKAKKYNSYIRSFFDLSKGIPLGNNAKSCSGIEGMKRNNVNNSLNTSQKWLIRRYDLLGAIKLILNGKEKTFWNISLYLIPFLIPILTIIGITHLFKYTQRHFFIEERFIMELLPVIFAVIIFVLLYFYRKNFLRKKNKIHNKSIKLLQSCPLRAVICGCIILVISYLFCKGIFDDSFLVLLLFSIPCSLIISLFFIYCISLFRNAAMPSILVPRTLMAVSSAWFAIIFAVESWQLNIDVSIGKAFTLGLVLSLIIASFMYIEVKNITKGSFSKIYSRILIIFCIALSYSFVIGTVCSNLIAQKMLIRNEISRKYWESDLYQKDNTYYEINGNNSLSFKQQQQHFERFDKLEDHKHLYIYPLCGYKLYIFPGILIINAFLAVFIGIFFQLIFDEKLITDPL